jgi:hypothetical protein
MEYKTKTVEVATTMDHELKTMGDRIQNLLRQRGRDERGREYEQRELVAMLNGQMPGPDGKYYNVGTSDSSVSRLIGDDLTRPSFKVLDAICDMFDTDMEWIMRGKTLDAKGAIEVFVTDEANQTGALVEAMSDDMRIFVLELVRKVYAIDQERRSLQDEVFELLHDTMPDMSGEARQKARSIVGKIHRRGFNTNPLILA